MREPYADETVRILENWNMWLANDKKPVSDVSPFPAYRLSGRGKRDGNVMPIFSIEAEKADRIISSMVHRYQHPLRMHYRWVMRSVVSKAKACNCAIGTYYERLNEAHRIFEREWYGAHSVRQALADSLKSAV